MQIWVQIAYFRHNAELWVNMWQPGLGPGVKAIWEMGKPLPRRWYLCRTVEGAAKAVSRALSSVSGPGAVKLRRHGVHAIRSQSTIDKLGQPGDIIVTVLYQTNDHRERKMSDPKTTVTSFGSTQRFDELSLWPVTSKTPVAEIDAQLRVLAVAQSIV